MTDLSIHGKASVTMTSLELVEFINSQRGEGESELRHRDFTAKVPKVLGEEMSEKFRASFKDSYGREQPGYSFPKREACLMAMSYSYELQAKVFDRMTTLEEKELSLQRKRSSVEWQKTRSDGKSVRFEFTGIVQEFVEYAKGQGSQSAQKYYMQLSKMENQALFMIDKAVGDGFRDRLESSQLIVLAMAEIVAQRALSEGMNAGWHYKEIYQHAKKEVEKLAAVTGKSVPGQTLFPGSRTPKVGFQGAHP